MGGPCLGRASGRGPGALTVPAGVGAGRLPGDPNTESRPPGGQTERQPRGAAKGGSRAPGMPPSQLAQESPGNRTVRRPSPSPTPVPSPPPPPAAPAPAPAPARAGMVPQCGGGGGEKARQAAGVPREGRSGPGTGLSPRSEPPARPSPPRFSPSRTHSTARGRLKGVGRRRGSGLALGSNQGKPLMNARATDTAGGGRHGGHVTAGGRPVERRERGGHRGADEVGELRHRLAAPALRALRQHPAVRPPPARRLLPFPASISPVHPRFKPFPGGGLVPPRLANRGGATWRPEGPQGLPQVARWSAEPSAASAGG